MGLVVFETGWALALEAGLVLAAAFFDTGFLASPITAFLAAPFLAIVFFFVVTDFLAAVVFFVAFVGALVTFFGGVVVDLTVFTLAVVRALVLGARTDTLVTVF